ncbi:MULTISPECIES: major capsid protein [Methylococcus]|uniref:Major capsid protein n=1 Tax=Methylococcus capsulatus (strain ATCC 33009 / NCIMB 11132 / Bath) TaxID=243233 RepID=Q602Y5_METCA|nr:major capsid protein [Methylococcus capsulatus]AAU90989.1 conserved hypothetical protein [Methylococcus capsulatus str. Bath]
MNLADLFTVTTLTAAVNKLPYATYKIRDLGIFAEAGVRTTTVAIEEDQGRLHLVPNRSRNDAPEVVRRKRRTRRVFETFHLAEAGVILPEDIQNIAPFGEDMTGSSLEPQARVINDKLQIMRDSIEITREWQRVGALGGQILDADGTVVYDLYNEFGVTKKTVDIAFGTNNLDVRAKIVEGKRHAEQKLTGATVTGFACAASKEFMDLLTDHPKVQAAYANWQAAQDRLGGDMRNDFTFGGVRFFELDVTVSGQRFIPAGKARLFPLGAGVFQMHNAPANYNETVNTQGQPYYSKGEPRKFNKGWDLEVQANPLALCLFPEALVEFGAV